MSEDTLKFQRSLEEYIEYFEKLSRRSIRLIENLAEPGVFFKDPFNEVQGTDAFIRIFNHMFDTLDKPKFIVKDDAWGRGGNVAYLRWVMKFELNGKPREIEGMSEVMFSKNGKVMSHIDHWDAGEQFYEHLPILGRAIKFVKSKLEV